MVRVMATLLLVALLGSAIAATEAADDFSDGAGAAFAETLQTLDIRKTRHEGVRRLAGDTVHGRYQGIQRVQITPDGTIWLLRRTADDKLYRAGRAGAWQREDGLANARELHVAPTGELVVRTNRTLVEREHKEWSASPKAPAVIRDLVLTEDGGAWAVSGRDLAAFDGGQWTTYDVEDLGLSYSLPFEEIRTGVLDGGVTSVAQAADGSVWVGAEDRNHRPAGLARFDGQAWREIHPFDLEQPIGVVDVAADGDGGVWVWVVPEGDISQQYLARWDGSEWMGWEAPTPEIPRTGTFIRVDMTVLPDGRLWVRWPGSPRLTQVFDGEAWVRLPTYTAEAGGTSVSQAPVPAPDGTLWVASDGQGYAQSVYIYDLDEVVPLATEAAVPFDPR